MCGIFGSNNITEFRKLCKINSKRGNYIRSVTTIGTDDIRVFHEQDFNKPILPVTDCLYYLGHVQSPTSSVRTFSKETSHPFTLNGQYLAHNGVLENDRELVDKMNLECYNDVDSSIILPLMEKVGFNETLEMLQGIFGCWYYNSKSGSLRIFRSGSTLHYNRGSFSSAALPEYKYIDEGIILEYNFTNNYFNEIDKFKLNSTPFFL